MKQPFIRTLPMYGMRIMLTAVSPFQLLLDRQGYTHEFCIRHAVNILRSDGFDRHARVCDAYSRELIAGVYWADTGWKNICHYYDPVRRLGLWNMPSAVEMFHAYYRQAMSCIRQGDKKRGMFYLGAASHLLQDLCVPHHALGQVFQGHKQFETWAGRHCEQFPVDQAGIYADGRGVTRLAMNNAVIAAEMFDLVRNDDDTADYEQAVRILLPLAQKSSAGLFEHFISVCARLLLTSKLAA